MTRYAVDIIRADGSYWRTVHLWAWSVPDAAQRAAGWVRREMRWDRGYTVANVREAPEWTP